VLVRVVRGKNSFMRLSCKTGRIYMIDRLSSEISRPSVTRKAGKTDHDFAGG